MSYSYSATLTAQRCLKQYEFKYVRNLQRKARSKAMSKGTYFHVFLMNHHLGITLDETLQQLLADVLTVIIDDEVITADELVWEAYDLAQRYLDFYQNDEWEILHVEETFTATLESGVELTFTPDLIIRDSTGVWIVDHKTTDRMPGPELPVGNLQAFLYSAVIRELYPDFKGFIFNFVRKKVPTEPRLTKTGEKRVARIGDIDTTYEILRDFLSLEAPDLLMDPTHKRRLAELKDGTKWYWRQYIFMTDTMVDQIIPEVEFTVATIQRAEEAGVYPRHFLPYAGPQECDNCPFRELCVAELRGYNTESIMYLYEEREDAHEYEYDEREML